MQKTGATAHPGPFPVARRRDTRKGRAVLSVSALVLAFVAFVPWPSTSLAQSGPDAVPDVAMARTQAVVDAATAFLETLDDAQRTAVLFPFDPTAKPVAARFARQGGPGGRNADDGRAPGGAPPAGAQDKPANGGPPAGGAMPGFVGEQYGAAVWSNYPASDVPRPGLALGEMTAAQRAAALHLLETVLSPAGYRKVLDIMGSDQALHETGTNYASGTDHYTLGLFGAPSVAAPWMLQFGAHHLGLNVVIKGAQGVATPTLTGAQPAVYTDQAGETVRVLAGENDRAFALLDALDGTQHGKAVLDYAVRDLVFGPGHDGGIPVPEGLQAVEMTAEQRAMLLDLIREWAGIVDDAYAAPRMAEIEAGLDRTWFAWSGPVTHAPGHNGSSYYRIQGPRLLIEFSPQGVGGDPTLHVHTVYRDPTNDYGQRFTAP
ncbi:DUF3500 domain-containing protein [Luteimonas sp. BDR2-5]|uniref:DUF3500 domain-containing protein n=1 Tax=Proluteimonas luteida TaxID=2878685 RepID=UPI001E40C8AD|nr:DUF3500 domain-containing protein [Luteimonas sp. BDR2-5]MCD9026868.1 DUF3500 domain-containing protein [Luteimonas sp. BDR2-5]